LERCSFPGWNDAVEGGEMATRDAAGFAGTPFWDFAVQLYSTPGVADACLALQDRRGCDVNVVLFAAWMGAVRCDRVTIRDFGEIVARIKPWHNEIVRPLRAIRRRLKSGPFPAPSSATEKLREGIKAAELECERIELLQLEAFARDRHPTGDDPAEASIENLANAVRLFSSGEIDREATQLINAIHSALVEKLGPSNRFDGAPRLPRTIG
jgi:uncharacterized protein (TIGR02444 family)